MEKTVEIKTDSGTMRGMIHYPDAGSGPFPVVVVFHGFESNRMGSASLFVTLSRHLALHGYTSVRFDFIGCGESEGSFSDLTVSRELEEARAILEWTACQPCINVKRFALLGHSMGGSIAGMLAGKMSNGEVYIPDIEIKTVVLLAPAGELADRVNDELSRKGAGITLDSPELEKMSFPIPVGSELIGKGFFTDLTRHRVMDETARYPGPVTIIRGDDDNAVSSNVLQLYVDMLSRCTLHTIKGAGHKFSTAASKRDLLRLLIDHLADYL